MKTDILKLTDSQILVSQEQAAQLEAMGRRVKMVYIYDFNDHDGDEVPPAKEPRKRNCVHKMVTTQTMLDWTGRKMPFGTLTKQAEVYKLTAKVFAENKHLPMARMTLNAKLREALGPDSTQASLSSCVSALIKHGCLKVAV